MYFIIKEKILKMTESKINNKNQISLGNKPLIQIKDESIFKEDAILGFNNLSNKKTEPSNGIYKNNKCLKNALTLSKEQTKSREFDKRYDIFGNLITPGGKQKISFIDKVTKNNFVEVIKIENFKEYNKMEEVPHKSGNGCCLII